MKLLKYITPLSVLSLLWLFWGCYGIIFGRAEEAWGLVIGTLVLIFLFLPTLVINYVINQSISNKKRRLIIQMIVALFIFFSPYFLWLSMWCIGWIKK